MNSDHPLFSLLNRNGGHSDGPGSFLEFLQHLEHELPGAERESEEDDRQMLVVNRNDPNTIQELLETLLGRVAGGPVDSDVDQMQVRMLATSVALTVAASKVEELDQDLSRLEISFQQDQERLQARIESERQQQRKVRRKADKAQFDLEIKDLNDRLERNKLEYGVRADELLARRNRLAFTHQLHARNQRGYFDQLKQLSLHLDSPQVVTRAEITQSIVAHRVSAEARAVEVQRLQDAAQKAEQDAAALQQQSRQLEQQVKGAQTSARHLRNRLLAVTGTGG